MLGVCLLVGLRYQRMWIGQICGHNDGVFWGRLKRNHLLKPVIGRRGAGGRSRVHRGARRRWMRDKRCGSFGGMQRRRNYLMASRDFGPVATRGQRDV